MQIVLTISCVCQVYVMVSVCQVYTMLGRVCEGHGFPLFFLIMHVRGKLYMLARFYPPFQHPRYATDIMLSAR